MEPQAAGRCFHELNEMREIHWVARVAHLYVTIDCKKMIGTIGIVSATMEISRRPGILQCDSREAQDNDRPMYLKLSMDIAQDKRVVEIFGRYRGFIS